MQLDPGAVAQIARTYHGYYRVDGGGHGHVLRYMVSLIHSHLLADFTASEI